MRGDAPCMACWWLPAHARLGQPLERLCRASLSCSAGADVVCMATQFAAGHKAAASSAWPPPPPVLRHAAVCLQFMSWAQAVCGKLTAQGHWSDYIDPCSGLGVSGILCMHSPARQPASSLLPPHDGNSHPLASGPAACCHSNSHPNASPPAAHTIHPPTTTPSCLLSPLATSPGAPCMHADDPQAQQQCVLRGGGPEPDAGL